MDHLEEFKLYGTCAGWKEKDVPDDEDFWTVKLMFEDVKNKTTLVDKVVLKIAALTYYNNVDYIPKDEIYETAKKIVEIFVK